MGQNKRHGRHRPPAPRHGKRAKRGSERAPHRRGTAALRGSKQRTRPASASTNANGGNSRDVPFAEWGLDSGGSSSTESTRAAMRDYAQHASDLDLSASEMLESVSELMRIVDVGGAESPFEATDAAAGKGSASPSALQLTARSSRRAASQAMPRDRAGTRPRRAPLPMKVFLPGGVEGDPVTAATALDADDDNAMDTADGAADAAAASDVAAATSFSKLAAMAGRRPAGRQSAATIGNLRTMAQDLQGLLRRVNDHCQDAEEGAALPTLKATDAVNLAQIGHDLEEMGRQMQSFADALVGGNVAVASKLSGDMDIHRQQVTHTDDSGDDADESEGCETDATVMGIGEPSDRERLFSIQQPVMRKNISLREDFERVWDAMSELAKDSNLHTLRFPSMPRLERRRVHTLANAFSLKSRSHGSGKHKSIVIRRTADATVPAKHAQAAARVSWLEARLTNQFTPEPLYSRVSTSVTGEVGGDATPLSHENRGHRMLMGMGWQPGAGLGPQQRGITQPVRAVRRPHRRGIGDDG